MTLYHFDVSQNGGPWEEDDDGTKLSSADEARREAVALAHMLAKDGRATDLTIRVRNGNPTPLLTVRVSTSVVMRP
jgi:hypothetical protein